MEQLIRATEDQIDKELKGLDIKQSYLHLLNKVIPKYKKLAEDDPEYESYLRSAEEYLEGLENEYRFQVLEDLKSIYEFKPASGTLPRSFNGYNLPKLKYRGEVPNSELWWFRPKAGVIRGYGGRKIAHNQPHNLYGNI